MDSDRHEDRQKRCAPVVLLAQDSEAEEDSGHRQEAAIVSTQARERPEPLSKRERMAARELGRERTRRLERARKRLANIEKEITSLEEELEALAWKLGDPEVYRDGEAVRALEAERSVLRESIDARYGEWERRAAELEEGEVAAES